MGSGADYVYLSKLQLPYLKNECNDTYFIGPYKDKAVMQTASFTVNTTMVVAIHIIISLVNSVQYSAVCFTGL